MVSDESNLKCRWQVHLANGICIGAQGSIVEGLGIKSKVQFARIAFVLYKNCFRTLQELLSYFTKIAFALYNGKDLEFPLYEKKEI